jgi:hypothetical protein
VAACLREELFDPEKPELQSCGVIADLPENRSSSHCVYFAITGANQKLVSLSGTCTVSLKCSAPASTEFPGLTSQIVLPALRTNRNGEVSMSTTPLHVFSIVPRQFRWLKCALEGRASRFRISFWLLWLLLSCSKLLPVLAGHVPQDRSCDRHFAFCLLYSRSAPDLFCIHAMLLYSSGTVYMYCKFTSCLYTYGPLPKFRSSPNFGQLCEHV